MKKIFSLVALVGMFALMSFGFKAEKVNPSEELQDSCSKNAIAVIHDAQENGANLSSEEEYAVYGALYDKCIGL